MKILEKVINKNYWIKQTGERERENVMLDQVYSKFIRFNSIMEIQKILAAG